MQHFWLSIGLALTACESAPRSALEGPDPESLAQQTPARWPHSRAHAEAAADLQLAIAQGRLADARDQGRWFTLHPMMEQPGWRPYLDEMSTTALHIANANDLAAAGVELGRLGHACGGCHQASGANVSLVSATAPVDTSSLSAQMHRQQWAAARMWEGLSRGNDRAWTDGATVMVGTPVDIHGQMRDKPNVEAFELAERLHDQATHASALGDLDARANHYGEVMQTCAGCHRILRPQPVVEEQEPPLVSKR